MNKLKPDVIAKIYFLKTEEGGKKLSLTGDYFSCPVAFNNKSSYFDCRLLLYDVKIVNPGDTLSLPIKFLDSQTTAFQKKV